MKDTAVFLAYNSSFVLVTIQSRCVFSVCIAWSYARDIRAGVLRGTHTRLSLSVSRCELELGTDDNPKLVFLISIFIRGKRECLVLWGVLFACFVK